MSHAPAKEFDATDPHGAQAGRHHVVVSWQMLVFILGTLLALTALTVFTAQAEAWVQRVWGIDHLPGWINLAGAMSIATVKVILVAAFFMQLKYDKAINTIIMVACLFCVWLFIMFCMIDLGNRGQIESFKTEHRVAGGTGQDLGLQLAPGVPAAMSSRLSPHISTNGMSLPEFVALQALTNFPDESERGKKIAEKYFDDPYYTENSERGYWHWYYDYTYVNKGKAPHHHERDEANHYESFLEQNHAALAELGLEVHHEGHAESDANISRPRHGLTEGLFDAAHAEDSHESTVGHSETESHDQESASEPESHDSDTPAPVDPPLSDDH